MTRSDFLRASAGFALAGLFSVLLVSAAGAVPVRSDGGGKCDSTGTERRTGKDQDGNKLDCKWDTCTYTKCSTDQNQISQCVKKTEYSNPRDCKSVSGKVLNKDRFQTEAPQSHAPKVKSPKQRLRPRPRRLNNGQVFN
ncbi:hypothetical protein [Zhengella mangrovi]|uniref:hypothetical protein n=1 Tax=Zhengella mangrovi TaxID=1982044 RepID=UPI001056625B|nr:hypothetical protein [Zhengella mangrovi]